MSARTRAAGHDSGFSLLEVVLALAITLVVMAMVAQTMRHATDIYETQTELAESSTSTLGALEDIALELGRAGQGLGDDVGSVLPEVGERGPSASLLTVRSNPELLASSLHGELGKPAESVPAPGAERFKKGALALVASARGRSEPAEVASVGAGTIALRSLGDADGSFEPPYSREDGARLLGLREVRYFLEETETPSKSALVKDVLGGARLVLSRDVVSIGFEYLTAEGAPIAVAKAATSPEVATVRVRLEYAVGNASSGTAVSTTAVTLRPRSGTVDFERNEVGFRLSRIFYPLDHPAGVASRIGADWAAILASGASPARDPAYLYTFETEKGFLSASVDEIVWLEDVRSPVTLAFGPESGRFAGSLFVAAWGIRIGHIMRLAPDDSGRFSAESEVTTFEGTEAIAQAGGIAFGVDGALYVTSREKGAVYRFRFDDDGEPSSPERLFDLPGTPGEMAQGRDGHLYFLMNQSAGGGLWRMAFDETLSPVEPELVGALPGAAISLASDPVEGSFFVLVRTRIGDFQLIELERGFLRSREDPEDRKVPEAFFSLEEWQGELEAGRVEPGELPFPRQELPRRMEQLRTEALTFVAFDEQGSLYLGAKEKGLVLQFELDRPSGRYAVGVSAGVVDSGEGSPEVRIHAWKKRNPAR